MFVQFYSYNRPFGGSHNVEVALSENEFDPPPALDYTHLMEPLKWNPENNGKQNLVKIKL